MDYFGYVFILGCSTREKVFSQQLLDYFFRKTLEISIVRLVSMRHRVKFATCNSSKFQNHSGKRIKNVN